MLHSESNPSVDVCGCSPSGRCRPSKSSFWGPGHDNGGSGAHAKQTKLDLSFQNFTGNKYELGRYLITELILADDNALELQLVLVLGKLLLELHTHPLHLCTSSLQLGFSFMYGAPHPLPSMVIGSSTNCGCLPVRIPACA